MMGENVNQTLTDWEIGNNLMIFKGTSGTKEELDKEWQNFEANMTPDQQMKSDDESIRIYGKTNLERYKEKLEKFKAGWSSHNQEDTLMKESNITAEPETTENTAEEMHMPIELEYIQKINLAKEYMKNANTTVIYPTETLSELEALWNKMNNTVSPDNVKKNDDMCIQLFGMSNAELYNAWKDKLVDFHYEMERRFHNAKLLKNAEELRKTPIDTTDASTVIEKCSSLINEMVTSGIKSREITNSVEAVSEELSSFVEYTPMASLNPVIGIRPSPMYIPFEYAEKIDSLHFSNEELKKKIIKYNTIFDSTFKGESTTELADIQEEWQSDVAALQKTYQESHDKNLREAIFALGWHPDYDITAVTNWEAINNNTLNRVSEYYQYNNSKIIDIHEFVKLANTDTSDIDKAKIERKKNLNPVYVVLVSGTKENVGSCLIRWWTKGPYCHAALGLNYDLNDLVSFNNVGGEHQGLSKESLSFYTPEERIGVYTIFIDNEDYAALKKNIQYYLNNKKETHYSKINILTTVLQKPLNFQFDMVCSQFVDRLLKFINIDITNKDSSLVSSNDFYRAAGFNKRIYKLYDGKIKDYNAKRIRKAVDKLLNSDTTKYFKETVNLLEVGAKLLKHKTTSTVQKLNGLYGDRIENIGGGKVSGDYHNAILQHGIESDKEDIDEYKELLGRYKDTPPEEIVEEYNLWLDGEFNRLTKIFAVKDQEELDDLRAYRLDDKHNDPSGINYALSMKADIDKLARMGYSAKEVKNIIISDYFAKIDNPDDLKKMLTARVNYSRKMFRLFKVMAKKNYQLLEMAESDVDDMLSEYNLDNDEKYAAVKQIKTALNKNSKKFEVNPGVYDLRELGAGVVSITPKLKNKELHTLARLIQQALEWDVVVVAHGNTSPNINGIQDYISEFDTILQANKKEKQNFFKDLDKVASQSDASKKYAEEILKVIEHSFEISKSKHSNELIVNDKDNKFEIILNELIEEQPKTIEHIEHILQKSSIKMLEDLLNEIHLECLGTNKSTDEDFDTILRYIQVEVLIPVVFMQCKFNALNKYILNYADWIWTTQPVYTLNAGPFRSMNELLHQLIYEENFKKILLYNCNPGGYPIPEDIKNAHVVIKYGTTVNFAEDTTITNFNN